MKAAVLHGTQEVVYEDIERSEPAAGEVVVKVHYTGVCGSDAVSYTHLTLPTNSRV